MAVGCGGQWWVLGGLCWLLGGAWHALRGSLACLPHGAELAKGLSAAVFCWCNSSFIKFSLIPLTQEKFRSPHCRADSLPGPWEATPRPVGLVLEGQW